MNRIINALVAAIGATIVNAFFLKGETTTFAIIYGLMLIDFNVSDVLKKLNETK